MNQSAFDKICSLLESSGVSFHIFEHEPSRSSEESREVRLRAGVDAIGAKALLCKLDFLAGVSVFATLVLPGVHKLDKKLFKQNLPDLRYSRFATAEELMDLAGVEYGCMPPFGKQVFPRIERLYISSALKDFENIAFNAAYFEKSITLKSVDYLKVIKPDGIFGFSVPK